jgi:hypothetical protein
LTTSSLSAIADPGSQLIVGGTLDLGGATITDGGGAVPLFALGNGCQVTDGTLKIAGGKPLTATGTTSISAALVDNGGVTVAGASAHASITDAVTGNGTISLAATRGYLGLGASIGAGQTIAFLDGSETLGLTTAGAEAGFSATLGGFAVGDKIALTGETITAAGFSGSSILVTLSTGSTMDFATSSALTGSLSVLNSGGNATLTYTNRRKY